MMKTMYDIDWGMETGKKFQLYLMTSYIYYELNKAVIRDTDYDRLCNDIYKDWDNFEHQHKHLVTKDDLSATTGFAIKYPTIVINAASILLENHTEI